MNPLTTLIFAGLIGLSGCARTMIPSVEASISRTDGHRSWDANRQINIGELIPYMRRATWMDGWVPWKTSADVVLSDGKKIQFERLQPMFRVEGVEGTFLILQSDVVAYETLRDRVVIGGSP